MQLVTQGSSQLQTIFGSGYVSEQSGDETHRHLTLCGDSNFAADVGGILKALRTALSLR